MTIASTVLDFYDDSEHDLMMKIASPSGLSGVQIDVLDAERHAELPDDNFGLVILTKRASVLRKFPLNDAGNAWLSSQYFSQTHEKLAFPARFIAATFIKEACDAYEVPASRLVEEYAARATDVDSNTFVEGSEKSWMLRKLASREMMTKSASDGAALADLPNEHFAMVIKQGDGEIIRKYAMPDAAHVKMAAAYFDKYAMELPPQYRHRFASSVQNRAQELNVDVSSHDSLYKWASGDWNKHIHTHLEHRKSLLPGDSAGRGILDKLAAAIGETTPSDMAEALSEFDQATGISRYYDKGLTDPYASTMAKAASGWSDEIDGQTITEDHLRKVASSAKLASYLGQSFANQFSKNPVEIFESLPSPEKTLIKQLAFNEA